MEIATGEALLSALDRAEAQSIEEREALSMLRDTVTACALQTKVAPPVVSEPLDYVALLPTDRARAHRAKSRARARLSRS